MSKFGPKRWKQISELVVGRSPIQCLHRWTKILRPGLTKGPWKKAEDLMLVDWVRKHGATNWAKATKVIRGRSGKQIRERWFNTLNPNVKKGAWSASEDALVFDLYARLGAKWTLIANEFSGRTENSVKNRFYSTLRRIAAEQVRLQQGTVSRETLKTENLLSYFEIAREQLSSARTQEQRQMAAADAGKENRRDGKENMPAAGTKRKHCESVPTSLSSESPKRPKLKRPKAQEAPDLPDSCAGKRKRAVALKKTFIEEDEEQGVRLYPHKAERSSVPLEQMEVDKSEAGYSNPNGLQSSFPVLRPVAQYQHHSSVSASSSAGTDGVGAAVPVKYCGNCNYSTEHMVVPLKKDGATVDEEKMEDLTRIRYLVGQYAVLQNLLVEIREKIGKEVSSVPSY